MIRYDNGLPRHLLMTNVLLLSKLLELVEFVNELLSPQIFEPGVETLLEKTVTPIPRTRTGITHRLTVQILTRIY